jgi:hypothetical protein
MAEREDVVRSKSARAPAGGGEQKTDELRSDIRHTMAEMSDTVGAIKEKFSSGHVKARVKESIIGRAGRMGSRAGDRAGDIGSNMVDTIKSNPVPIAMVGLGIGWLVMRGSQKDGRGNGSRTKEHFQGMMQSNILGLSAMALALGALIGLAIPESQREAELMEKANESVAGKAKSIVQGAMEKAQHAAMEEAGR